MMEGVSVWHVCVCVWHVCVCVCVVCVCVCVCVYGVCVCVFMVCVCSKLTTLVAAGSEEHLKVVLTILPAFKLQRKTKTQTSSQ